MAGAVAAFEKLLSDRERVLGPDHPLTLLSQHDLAAWRVTAGTAGSMAAFKERLNHMQQVLGLEHPFVITARHNLVGWQEEVANTDAGLSTD